MPRVFKQFAVVILVAAASSAILSGCSTSKGNGGGGGKDVAATVNGKNITLSEVDRVISQQTGGQQSKMMPLELATVRLQALSGLIEEEILVQRAEKEKLLPTDDEVTQAINDKKREANLTEEEYQKMLKENGQTEQELRDTARKQLALRKLVQKTVGNVTVNNDEVDAFYNANKERFVSPRGVAISMIAADPMDSAGQYPDDAKSELEAKTKIDNIYAQLRSGADFATVARQRSEDPSFMRGGDFSFWNEQKIKGSGLPPEIVSNLFGAMKPGDITPPFHMQDGRWIILKLTDRQLQDQPQTLDTPGVRDQIKQLLVEARQKVLGDALRVVAMNEAKVENYLAQDMIKNPSTLGGNQPASPNAGASPAASATPAATASPAASSTPAGAPSPKK